MMLRAIIIPLAALTGAGESAEQTAEYRLDCSVSGVRQKGEAVAVQLDSTDWIIRFAQPSLSPSEATKAGSLSVSKSGGEVSTVKIELVTWRQSVGREGTTNFYAVWNAALGQSFPVSRLDLDRLDDARFALKADYNDFATCPHGPPPGAPSGECDSTQYSYNGECELKPEATS